MANRHLARSIALQSLFEWDFNGSDASKLRSIIERNIDEFGPGIEDTTFVYNLAEGVQQKQSKLDLIISKAAPDWPLAQIAVVDRNVLRLGLYELLFAKKQEVPSRVAINEAIELAKTFGGENSGRFVNGVLGSVYRQLGEPGKDEPPAKAKRNDDLPFESLPVERLGGAVVYTRDRTGEVFLALVHDIFGYWTLSKGHIAESEDLKSGVQRVVKSELGLEVTVENRLGPNEYLAINKETGGKVRKQVVYFLCFAAGAPAIHLAVSGGLDQAAWFKAQDIVELKIYDDIVPFITKGLQLVAKKKK